MFYNGVPLFIDGQWAMGPACCCESCSCDQIADTLRVQISWCGISNFNLPRIAVGSGDWLLACPTVHKAWRGSGIFGGGPGSTEMEAACLSLNSKEVQFFWRYTPCVGTLDTTCPQTGFGNPLWRSQILTCPLPSILVSLTDAPPSGCGTCVEMFTLTISH